MSAHVYQVLAPARYGGAETVCLALSAALRETGIACTLVVLAAGERPTELLARADELGIPTQLLSNGRRGYAADVRALRAIAADDPRAILHSHLPRANLVCRCVSLLTGHPCVATFHGYFGRSLRGRAYDLADWTVVASMDAIVTVTQSAAATIGRRSSRAARRCRAVPSALHPEPRADRASARRALGLAADGTVLGWVGRFVEQKDPTLFVRCVAALAEGRLVEEPWQAAMLGDGPLLGAARDAAYALGVGDRIAFCGYRAGAGPHSAAFDALVMTSRGEELPTVLLESLQQGVPAVSTHVGDVPAIAAACDAVRLCEAHADALARTVAGMIRDRAMDPHAMARAGTSYVARHHGAPAWAERHRELYAMLLASDGRRLLTPEPAEVRA